MTGWIFISIVLILLLASDIYSNGFKLSLIQFALPLSLGAFCGIMKIYFGRVSQAISIVAIFVLTIYLNYRNYKNKNKKSEGKNEANHCIFLLPIII